MVLLIIDTQKGITDDRLHTFWLIRITVGERLNIAS